jgi:hypothetical protein
MSTIMFCREVVDIRVTEAVWTSPATRGFFETEELTMETRGVVVGAWTVNVSRVS